jgi:hypothetical protein
VWSLLRCPCDGQQEIDPAVAAVAQRAVCMTALSVVLIAFPELAMKRSSSRALVEAMAAECRNRASRREVAEPPSTQQEDHPSRRRGIDSTLPFWVAELALWTTEYRQGTSLVSIHGCPLAMLVGSRSLMDLRGPRLQCW